MQPTETQFIDVGRGAASRRIATLVDAPPAAPAIAPAGLVWLPGFKSEMTSLKATALAAYAARHGLGMTRFDYSGHGQSGGAFEEGTIGRWLEEAVAVFAGLTRGPQVVVGSSMGGYIALLLQRALAATAPEHAARLAALVLIAPAWDMTERLMWPRMTAEARRNIETKGVYLRPSHYGDGPYAITRGLIEEGRAHLIGATPYDPGCPVHILHGLVDPDVPWRHSLGLMALLPKERVRLTVVPDGEHRLSRPEDLRLLEAIVESYAGGAPRGGGRD